MNKLLKYFFVFVVSIALMITPFSSINVYAENVTDYNSQTIVEDNVSVKESQSDYANCLFGDVNLDGRIDISDAVLLNKAVAGAVTLTEQQVVNADVCKNDEVSLDDAIALLKFLVRLEENLPVYPESTQKEIDGFTYKITGASYNCSDFNEFNMTGVTVHKYDSEGEEVDIYNTLKIGRENVTPSNMYTFDIGQAQNSKCIINRKIDLYEGDKIIGKVPVLVGLRGDINFDGCIDSKDVEDILELISSRETGKKYSEVSALQNCTDDNERNLALVLGNYIKASPTTSTNLEDTYNQISSEDAQELLKTISSLEAGEIRQDTIFKYAQNDSFVSILEYIGNEDIIEIPEQINGKNVTSIASLGKNDASKIKVPRTVIFISPTAFIDMAKLKSIEVDANTPYYTADNGILYNKSGNKLEYCPRDINMTTISIADKVTGLADYAFYENNNIQQIELGTGISKLDSVFSLKTQNLTKVSVKDGNNTYYSPDGISLLTKNDNSLVCAPTKGDYIIPTNVKSIGSAAFSNCNLGIIKFPENTNISYIHMHAFYHCTAERLTMDNSTVIDKIGGGAFVNCDINEIILAGKILNLEPNFYESSVEKLEIISNGLINIEIGSFDECENLKEVSIKTNGDNSIVNVSGLYGCEKLKIDGNVNIEHSGGSSLTSLELNGKAIAIGTGAFADASLTGELYIPYVDKLGVNSFMGVDFTSVNIQYGLIEIGSCAFYGCENLTDITLPDSVSVIGWYAFYGCTSLKNIVIPENAQLRDGVFLNCDNLEEVTIKSKTIIDSSMFEGCTKLKTVNIREGSLIEEGAIPSGVTINYIDENGNPISK